MHLQSKEEEWPDAWAQQLNIQDHSVSTAVWMHSLCVLWPVS